MALGRSNIHPSSGMPAQPRTLTKPEIDARLRALAPRRADERIAREIDHLLANRYLLDHPDREA